MITRAELNKKQNKTNTINAVALKDLIKKKILKVKAEANSDQWSKSFVRRGADLGKYMYSFATSYGKTPKVTYDWEVMQLCDAYLAKVDDTSNSLSAENLAKLKSLYTNFGERLDVVADNHNHYDSTKFNHPFNSFNPFYQNRRKTVITKTGIDFNAILSNGIKSVWLKGDNIDFDKYEPIAKKYSTFNTYAQGTNDKGSLLMQLPKEINGKIMNNVMKL